jgi:hypothetical protein
MNIFYSLFLLVCLLSNILSHLEIKYIVDPTDNDNKSYFIYNSFSINLKKEGEIVFIGPYNIPGDLLKFINENEDFNLLINLGTLPKFYRDYYQHLSHQQKTNYMSDEVLLDSPIGYFYYSQKFSPLNNEKYSRWRNFFDLFSHTFKIALNPMLDRSSFISPYPDKVFFFDNNERACSDHLDGIKEIFPKFIWESFTQDIDYHEFVSSDYKTIKISFDTSSNLKEIKIQIKVIYKADFDYIRQLRIKKDLNPILLFPKNIEKKLTSFRYFKGNHWNFDNYEYINELNIENQQELKTLSIVDLVPWTLDLIYSSIKLEYSLSSPETNITNIIDFNPKLLEHIPLEQKDQLFTLSFIEGIEKQNPVVPYTYESRRNTRVIFKLNSTNLKQENLFTKINIKIHYQLRKRLINFESFDNEMEYGFKYPCGLIEINNNYLPTSHIYYNMHFVDNTMPFNIIAFSWVVYGFIFIQILNLFLGNRGQFAKSIWQRIKDRFMAKWGFLFGR